MNLKSIYTLENKYILCDWTNEILYTVCLFQETRPVNTKNHHFFLVRNFFSGLKTADFFEELGESGDYIP